MNYKPIWFLGHEEIGRNQQVFATYDEAFDSAKARFNVWTQPTDFGVEQTDDPVTYARKNNTDYNLQTGMLEGETT
jgi:hypothetical protein